MPPLSCISFQVEVPCDPVAGKEVFTLWLRKRGHMQSEEISGIHYVFKFDTNKFVRKDALHISLQTAFVKSGLQGGLIKLTSLKIAAPKEPTIAELATEIMELRKLVGPGVIHDKHHE